MLQIKDIYWEIQENENNTKYYTNNIIVCPCPGCKYFTDAYKSLLSHITASHKDFDNKKEELGWYWTMIITYAKTRNILPNALNILQDKKGFICKVCNIHWGSNSIGIVNHIKKQHLNFDYEGGNIRYRRINC